MQMFYAVYLIDVDIDIIIPIEWLRDNEIYHERFVNYSLNNSQTHLCYWNSSPDAITATQQPNPQFPPNFDAEIKNSYPSAEACYRCRVIKCTRKYDDVADFCKRRRERLPALYEKRRRQEYPIPDLAQDIQVEADNFAILENEAAEPFNEPDNDAEEQEILIPYNHHNPVVVLERVIDQNQAFEAEYEINSEANNEIELPVLQFDDPLNVNDNGDAVIKFEVLHDYNEVDGILDGTDMNNIGQIECELDLHTHDDNKRDESNDEFVRTSNGSWQIEEVSDVNASYFDCRNKIGSLGTETKFQVNDNVGQNVSFGYANSFDYIDESATIEEAIPSTSHDYGNMNSVDGNVSFESENASNPANNVGESASGDDDNMNIIERFDDEISGSSDETGEQATDGEAGTLNNDGWQIVEDDVSFIAPKEWPMPKTFELSGLVKRENDRFSGNLPFSLKTKKNKTFREYLVGYDRIVKVPITNVNTCIKWSASPFANEISYDRKIAYAMLTLSHTKAELSVGKINKDAVEFVKHLLNVRAKGDSQRLDMINTYIQEMQQRNQAQN